jgi:phosphoribosylamine--glycine ligase
MKVLLVDYYGTDGMLDFAMRAQDDGHDVRWFFKRDGKNDWVGKGMVSRVADWRDHVRWADIVLLSDNTHYLHELDRWRREGKPVIGASVESSRWELDRKLGQDVFRKAGIEVPPFREFTRYDDAMAYVKREGRAFVSKPSYDEIDKSLSYVGKTPADLVYMLGKWKRQNRLDGAFILQEKVSGCEMAVGGYIGPHGFISGWCENWEFKKLMAGDMGPNVGEMGTVLRFTRRSKLADKVLKPLEDRIVAAGHTGYVDVNCIIDEDGQPWPLEFTMRPGWPTFNIQQSLNEGDTVEWLANLAEGRDSKPWRFETICAGVVMALPGFPYGKTKVEDMVGVPLQGVTSSMASRLHPCSVMMGSAPTDVDGKVVDQPCWMTAGDYVLVGTGLGDSVRQARERALKVLEKIQAPASPFWRKDIGERLKTQLPEVQKHGFASKLQF